MDLATLAGMTAGVSGGLVTLANLALALSRERRDRRKFEKEQKAEMLVKGYTEADMQRELKRRYSELTASRIQESTGSGLEDTVRKYALLLSAFLVLWIVLFAVGLFLRSG